MNITQFKNIKQKAKINGTSFTDAYKVNDSIKDSRALAVVSSSVQMGWIQKKASTYNVRTELVGFGGKDYNIRFVGNMGNLKGLVNELDEDGVLVRHKFLDSKRIKDGVWSLPKTEQQARKWNEICSKSWDWKNGEKLKSELYNIFGSDDLFDDIDEAIDEKRYLTNIVKSWSGYLKECMKLNNVPDRVIKIIKDSKIKDIMTINKLKPSIQKVCNEWLNKVKNSIINGYPKVQINIEDKDFYYDKHLIIAIIKFSNYPNNDEWINHLQQIAKENKCELYPNPPKSNFIRCYISDKKLFNKGLKEEKGELILKDSKIKDGLCIEYVDNSNKKYSIHLPEDYTMLHKRESEIKSKGGKIIRIVRDSSYPLGYIMTPDRNQVNSCAKKHNVKLVKTDITNYNAVGSKENIKNFVNEMFPNHTFKIENVKDVEPRKDESKQEFIARFMNETKNEYPDEKQRYAVANSYWSKKDSKVKDSRVIFAYELKNGDKFIDLTDNKQYEVYSTNANSRLFEKGKSKIQIGAKPNGETRGLLLEFSPTEKVKIVDNIKDEDLKSFEIEWIADGLKGRQVLQCSAKNKASAIEKFKRIYSNMKNKPTMVSIKEINDSIKDDDLKSFNFTVHYKNGNVKKEKIIANDYQEALKKVLSRNDVDSVDDWHDSIKDDDLTELSQEELTAIEDYKRAISNTKNVKLLELYSHILREEIEHLDELNNAKTNVGDSSNEYYIIKNEDGTWEWRNNDFYNYPTDFGNEYKTYEEAKQFLFKLRPGAKLVK